MIDAIVKLVACTVFFVLALFLAWGFGVGRQFLGTVLAIVVCSLIKNALEE